MKLIIMFIVFFVTPLTFALTDNELEVCLNNDNFKGKMSMPLSMVQGFHEEMEFKVSQAIDAHLNHVLVRESISCQDFFEKFVAFSIELEKLNQTLVNAENEKQAFINKYYVPANNKQNHLSEPKSN